MKLRKIIISNFRGVQDSIEISINDFNTIVGKNDAGKSTILKALDLFFNTPTFDKDWKNKFNDNPLVSIEVFLIPNESEIIIDENITTTFEAEEILNSEGYLHIKRIWDSSKTSRITPDTYVTRKEYSRNDFLLKTQDQLISICEDLGIETSRANGEEYNNAEKREKIRQSLLDENVEYNYKLEKIPTSGTSRLRNIGQAINTSIPRFEYFKADTSLSETDTSIQNYFKKIAVKTFEEEVDRSSVENQVRAKLQSILSVITTKINSVVSEDEQVEASVDFDWSKLVQTKFNSVNNGASLPLNARGDGFRRITMMSYFEYLAEEETSNEQNIIFGFEEPETFLHPSSQETLFDKLYALSQNNYSVVVSTHSPILVSKSRIEDLIHITKINNNYNVEQNITDVSTIVSDLGITVENQFVSLFDTAHCLFLVEGIGDVIAQTHLAEIYKSNGEITQTYEENNIAIIPIGGCGSIKHWVNLNLLNRLNKPFFILQDSDIENEGDESPRRQELIALGFTEGDDFHILKKRETENYIPASALNRIVPDANLTYGDFDDVKKLCKSHQYSGRLGGRNVLERHFSHLTYEELKSTYCPDGDDEFLEIYRKVFSKIGS